MIKYQFMERSYKMDQEERVTLPLYLYLYFRLMNRHHLIDT